MSGVIRIVCLLLYVVEADATASFKKEPSFSIQWLPYCIVLGVLFLVFCTLTKYMKPKNRSPKKGTILDVIALHHKTKAYVLEYQGQQFIIAEHANAIAIQALKPGDSSS